MLAELQKYAFATTGMLVVKNFYRTDTVEQMLFNIDATKPQTLCIKNDPKLFMSIMSDSRIIDFCSKFIGPWFRFDHELVVNQTKESQPYLHGGQFGSHGTCFYHEAERYSWNGQLTVGIVLIKQNSETGGFAYIPGSQHSNHGGQYGQQLEVWKEAINELAIVPELNPGDLYIFSEALVHGQKQWNCNFPRTTFYMKYVPGYMAWQDYEITQSYLSYAKNDLQRALLAPPYVRQGGGDVWPHSTPYSFRQSITRLDRKTIN